MSKTTVPTKQHIRSSFRDAAYTSLNIGMAESYFAAFMLTLGFSEVTSGLGTIIPQFIGVIFQLLSIRSFFTKYSLKKRLVLFLTLQALSYIPLLLIGVLKFKSPVLVIAVLGIYWGSLLSLNPPWNRLIGHTVPVPFRIRFFSIRNQFGQFAVFFGLISSGLLLYWAKEKGIELSIFVGIFCFGFILKCLSIYEISKNHNDYELATGSEVKIGLFQFLKRLKGTDQGKLISFLFFFYIGVHFSAPYFQPYMLSKLKFNYLQFMTITSLAYFGRIFIFRLLQNRAKERHIEKILLFSTIGISSSPILWAISQNFIWIACIEFISGCYWAGFELSTILLYYQKIDDRERTSIVTYITLLNTAGMMIGSMLGALLMKFLPPDLDQYATLFAVATFLRISIVVFAPQINFKGQIPKLIGFNRIISIRPGLGVLTRPFIGKVKTEPEKKNSKDT